jgi:hypothetical protein
LGWWESILLVDVSGITIRTRFRSTNIAPLYFEGPRATDASGKHPQVDCVDLATQSEHEKIQSRKEEPGRYLKGR